VDGAEALGPGAAKELHEDGLGLVVAGVGGEDGVGGAGGEELVEDLVAEGAGGLFEGLAGGGGVGGDVDAVEVEGDVEAAAEIGDEGLVGVGLLGAEAVVDVDGGEAGAEGVAGRGVGGMEGEEERDGVGTAGDGGAEAVAGAEMLAGEGKRGGGGWGHRVPSYRGGGMVWRCVSEGMGWVGCRYTAAMFETRSATIEDAERIGQQRKRMFVSAGQPDDARMAEMAAAFVPWVREKLAEGKYVGWLVSVREGAVERVVGGAGLWLMEFPPHFLQVAPVRAYLLNFYVEPEFRGHGLAKALLETAIAEARRRGCEVVTLHASKFGRPIYGKRGFKQTNEMMLCGEGSAVDRTRG
jgi:ribosomal protein S18 acetylase RimI-like enzyme